MKLVNKEKLLRDIERLNVFTEKSVRENIANMKRLIAFYPFKMKWTVRKSEFSDGAMLVCFAKDNGYDDLGIEILGAVTVNYGTFFYNSDDYKFPLSNKWLPLTVANLVEVIDHTENRYTE